MSLCCPQSWLDEQQVGQLNRAYHRQNTLEMFPTFYKSLLAPSLPVYSFIHSCIQLLSQAPGYTGKGHSGEQERCRLDRGIQPEKASDLIQTQYTEEGGVRRGVGCTARGLTHLGLWQVKAAVQSGRAVQTEGAARARKAQQ